MLFWPSVIPSDSSFNQDLEYREVGPLSRLQSTASRPPASSMSGSHYVAKSRGNGNRLKNILVMRKFSFFFYMLCSFSEKNRSPKFRWKKITGSARNVKNAFLRRRGRRSKKSTFSKLAETLAVYRQHKTGLDFLIPFFSKFNSFGDIKH